MKKSQLRANLLSDSSVYPPIQQRDKSINNQQQGYDNNPTYVNKNQQLQFVSHPLAAQGQYQQQYINSSQQIQQPLPQQRHPYSANASFGGYQQPEPELKQQPQPQPFQSSHQQQQLPQNQYQYQYQYQQQHQQHNQSYPQTQSYSNYTEYPVNISQRRQYSNGSQQNTVVSEPEQQPMRNSYSQEEYQQQTMRENTRRPQMLRPSDQIFKIGDDDNLPKPQRRHVSGDYPQRGPNLEQQKHNQQQPFERKKSRVDNLITSEESNNSKSKISPDRLQFLEEKIQKLERALALQEMKVSNESEASIISSNSEKNAYNDSNSIKPESLVESTNSLSIESNDSFSTGNAPPLPPPPPAEKKSILSSPNANKFLSSSTSTGTGVGMTTGTSSDINYLRTDSNNDSRHSASSLIPTDKSVSDQSIEDPQLEFEEEDLPPPSYEELEKSGTLTYSQSIYRTGFEKAGFQMDHVLTPTSPDRERFSSDLKSKRKLPPPLPENFDQSDKLKASINEDFKKSSSDSIPTLRGNPVPLPSLSVEPKQKIIDNNNVVIPQPISESSLAPIKQKTTNQSTEDSLYSVKKRPTAKEIDNDSVIKYSTPMSFKTLSNGIIEPILPSKSKEPIESVIHRFRVTREKALEDYKQFTSRIQFNWAILLLETMSRPEILSKMAIDGKLRKKQINYKKLDAQREMFLITSIKVLEKLVQISRDETRARLYLGDIYSGGIHPGIVQRDEVKGYQLFFDAATKQNDAVACYRVACCFESGVGCKKDIEKSLKFFHKGASLGDPSSMCQLGMMHFAGVNGCPLDIPESINYHKNAVETLRSSKVMSTDPLISARSFQDARGALYTLAKLHQTDLHILCLTDLKLSKTIFTIEQLKNLGVFCNVSKSLKYFLEAAKLNHAESQACLGYYYSQGFFPTLNFKSDKESHNNKPDAIDSKRSIYWFSKAASNDHVYASLGLAKWYGSGSVDKDGNAVLKKDEQQAFLWGRKAADEGGLPEAEFMIGMCFEQGFGTEKNIQMAVNYYKRSANRGYKKAINKLKILNINK